MLRVPQQQHPADICLLGRRVTDGPGDKLWRLPLGRNGCTSGLVVKPDAEGASAAAAGSNCGCTLAGMPAGAPPLACLKAAPCSSLGGNLPCACLPTLLLCCSLCCAGSSVGICRRGRAGRWAPPPHVASPLAGLSSVLQQPRELQHCLACTSFQNRFPFAGQGPLVRCTCFLTPLVNMVAWC